MRKDLRFGFTEKDMDRLKVDIEALLNVALEERDSGFYGGRYFRLDVSCFGQLILQGNFDSFEEEWIEEDYQDLPLILNVSGIDDAHEMKVMLASILGCKLIKETARP